MGFVKEIKESLIVDPEFVQMPPTRIILILSVMPIKLGVSLLARDVSPQKVLVQAIPVLLPVVSDLLDQMDIAKEQIPLQAHHALPRFVQKLQLLYQLMPAVSYIN